MDQYGYEGPEQFRPLSPWSYFGYSILFSIPLVGFVFLILFSISDKNIHRRNFARSYWCTLITMLILFVLLFLFSADAAVNYTYFRV